MAHGVVAEDPSLRLKNGYAQDDAIEATMLSEFKLTHYLVSSDSFPDSRAVARVLLSDSRSHERKSTAPPFFLRLLLTLPKS